MPITDTPYSWRMHGYLPSCLIERKLCVNQKQSCGYHVYSTHVQYKIYCKRTIFGCVFYLARMAAYAKSSASLNTMYISIRIVTFIYLAVYSI